MLATLALLAAAFAGPFMSDADAAQSVTCNHGSFPTTCDITEPTVTQFQTAYPQIQLYQGQQVRVQAGGCVQTGGSGKTWKRYVNPLDGNGSYHGLFNIPYTTNGSLPLENIQNATFTVTRNSYLVLDYDDDKYSDNGYWGHDDGTQNQCKGVGNAWVHLTIK